MNPEPADALKSGTADGSTKAPEEGAAADSHRSGIRAHPEPPASLPLPSDSPVAVRLIGASAAALLVIGVALLAWNWPNHALTLAMATGAAVGAALVTGVVASAYLGRPIRQLTRSVLAMSAGDRGARAPVRGDDETTSLARALNHLATEHGRALDLLTAERDLLASILDGMGEGVLVLDAGEQIVLVNRALRGLARLNEDAVGKPLIEAIRSAPLKEALEAVRAKDEAVVREIELGRPLPRKFLVRVSRLPQGSAQRGIIAVFHDVTDLRRLETIRTDFVANVSHELRTPVTAISTATETLLGGALADPTDAASFVDVIDRNALRLRQLVDDLLDLAKIEAKSFRMVLGEVELAPILMHVVDLMTDQARKKKMVVRLEAGTEGLRAHCDKRSLEQAIMNLVDNAIKYAGEGAQVVLGAKVDGERIEVFVADNGIGISPAHVGRVFERFYRVDAGRSREVGGTGLGLSIVKHLVELMGGRITVESEPGKGARFSIRLQPPGAGKGSPPPPTPSTTGEF